MTNDELGRWTGTPQMPKPSILQGKLETFNHSQWDHVDEDHRLNVVQNKSDECPMDFGAFSIRERLPSDQTHYFFSGERIKEAADAKPLSRSGVNNPDVNNPEAASDAAFIYNLMMSKLRTEDERGKLPHMKMLYCYSSVFTIRTGRNFQTVKSILSTNPIFFAEVKFCITVKPP